MLREWKVPCLIHQPSYNMLNRWIEGELLYALEKEGIGCIAFTPLARDCSRPNTFMGCRRMRESNGPEETR